MLLQPREYSQESRVVLSAAKDLASNPAGGRGEVLRCAQDDKGSACERSAGTGPIPLLVIGGSTASGKTEAAVRVAEAVGAEIVSADSMQIYQELEAGTAKPTVDELARAIFHLIDFVDPRQPYTVADFQRDAWVCIEDIHRRGKLPILCGGTGLYVRAALGALSFPPGATPETVEIRERLEAEADQLGLAALHERLQELDPSSAARLPVADRRRIIRALEVCEYTGAPFSASSRVDEAVQVNYNTAIFGLTRPRSLLYESIEARVDEMLARGWLTEVVALRERGLTTAHQAMQAIGYRHLLGHLDEHGEYGHVVERIKRDTRRYAKRQLTWFRRENLEWLEWSDSDDFAQAVQSLIAAARQLVHPNLL